MASELRPLECSRCERVYEMEEWEDPEERDRVAELKGWYVEWRNGTFREGPFHLCPEHRIVGTQRVVLDSSEDLWARCARCGEIGEVGRGKWNDNSGHVRCSDFDDAYFCYGCHGRMCYNK